MSTVPEVLLTRLSICSIQTPNSRAAGIVLVLEADKLEVLGNAISSSHFGQHSFFFSLCGLCIFVRNENAEKSSNCPQRRTPVWKVVNKPCLT